MNDNIKCVDTEMALKVVSSPIRGEPNNLIMGNKGGMVICPKQPNNLTEDLPTIQHTLDVKQVRISAQPNLDLIAKREKWLNYIAAKQPFRVSVGKSTWVNYEKFNPSYNLREILNDEIVVEFDSKKRWEDMTEQEKLQFQAFSLCAISQTGINLYKAGIEFEIWDHNGKSPHLHIHNLPIAHLEPDKRARFKKLFIKKYVPSEYFSFVDESLAGCHLIAIEWANHWKGCYDYKKLVRIYKKKEWGEL